MSPVLRQSCAPEKFHAEKYLEFSSEPFNMRYCARGESPFVMAEKFRSSEQMRELEELSRRQDELEHGRTEMADKLTRSLVVLEREAYNAQSRLEQIRAARESFGQHLELIEAIDPKSWNPSDLHKELSRALSTVDEARTVYNEQRSRLQAAGGNEGDASLPDVGTDAYESSDGRSFFQWFQIGIALTLPLIIFGAIALALFVWMASK